MQTRNRLFDDAVRLAGGAVGTLAGVRREIEALVRQQIERVLASLDLVTRDEFDAVKEMAIKARQEQEKLADRIASLENSPANKPSPARKTRKAPARKSSASSKASPASKER